MVLETWKVNPGRRPGVELSIEELLTRGYQAHAWMLETYRGEPAARRIQKGRFCTRMSISRPTINKYLRGGGVPFPFPPVDHLVLVVDVDDRTLRWVSRSVCEMLQRDEGEVLGKYAPDLLRGSRPSEPGHLEAVEALRRGEIDLHECHTTFARADGQFVHLRTRVSYGDAYRVWFVDATVDNYFAH